MGAGGTMGMRFICCLVSFFLLIAANGPPALGQTDRGANKSETTIRIEVNYVLVNVTVLDPFGRVITGLDKENFRIFEDGKEQEIYKFSKGDAPASIGLIVDVSGSMQDKIEKVRTAVSLFLRTCNPQDEFFLVTFGNGAAGLSEDFTNNTTVINDAMLRAKVGGRTALLDAIYLGLARMKNARRKYRPDDLDVAGNPFPTAKRALIVISDGGDNHSRYNTGAVENFLKEADTELYAIGIFNSAGRRPTPEETSGPELLQKLSEMTGGRFFEAESKDLPDIMAVLGHELRSQYVLMYRPANEKHDGQWRKIKVKVVPPKGMPPLKAYAKSGYYAPKN